MTKLSLILIALFAVAAFETGLIQMQSYKNKKYQLICFFFNSEAALRNPFLNKVCLDGTNGCDNTCVKKIFSFVKRLPNGESQKAQFACCMCPYVAPKAVCPYDPNCKSPNSCGAYLVKTEVNGVMLDCQKCDICDQTFVPDNIEYQLIFKLRIVSVYIKKY